MQHIKEGEILIFEAPQRGGKTLAMSIFAYYEYLKGRTIFTNLAYDFPYQEINFHELKLEKNEALEGSVITLDEFNFVLDARASMKKENREFSMWLYQLKKQGITFMGTTHDLETVDVRFRKGHDLYIQCQVIPEVRPPGMAPTYLKLVLNAGPLVRYFRPKQILINLEGLLGMYDTRNVFNPLAKPQWMIDQEEDAKLARKSQRRNKDPWRNPFQREELSL